MVMAASVSVGVALAVSIAVLGCARTSDERAEQTGGTSSAGGAPSFAGVLVGAAAGGPAETAGTGGVVAVAVAGVGGNDSVGGASGALVGGGGIPSLGGSGGALAQGGAGQSGVSVSLDLTPSLSIANETLFFPLTGTLLAPSNRGPSEPSGPSELAVIYTRVLCTGAHTETLTAKPYGFGDGGVPTLLASVTITQDLRGLVNPQAIVAQSTCLTRRTPEGHWLPLLSPTKVITTDGFVTFEFDVPVEPVDAVGMFLPTYTALSNITYTFHSP